MNSLQLRRIGTAPRDGTLVVYWSEDAGPSIGNQPEGHARGRWDRSRRGKWRGAATWEGCLATHWAPLPELVVSEDTEGMGL